MKLEKGGKILSIKLSTDGEEFFEIDSIWILPNITQYLIYSNDNNLYMQSNNTIFCISFSSKIELDKKLTSLSKLILNNNIDKK